ncbi:hypothetical protein [[Eubacterium] hominis]|uniref:hypothetical protein n=1 Tax=[Eubacterium] hominis TaxID=2764325 RepID=UPI003A4D9343
MRKWYGRIVVVIIVIMIFILFNQRNIKTHILIGTYQSEGCSDLYFNFYEDGTYECFSYESDHYIVDSSGMYKEIKNGEYQLSPDDGKSILLRLEKDVFKIEKGTSICVFQQRSKIPIIIEYE